MLRVYSFVKRWPLLRALTGRNRALARSVAFVVAFAAIGAIALIFTRAATPTASTEPEDGVIAGAACTTAPAGASGGSAVKFGSCGGGGGLPAGVTLQDIDGGQTYFEQWSNSFPSARNDPTFFPLGIFNDYDLAATSVLTPDGTQAIGSSKAVAYKTMGINTFVNLYNGFLSGSPSDISVVKNNGMYAIGGPETNAGSLSSFGNTAAAYVYQDEAENNTCSKIDVAWLQAYCTNSNGKTATSSFPTMTNQMHTFDPTRPVYNGFTNGYVFDWFLSGNAAQLAQGSDIIGYDVYPLTDRRSSFGGALTTGHVWGVYETVALSRTHTKVSGVYTKPVWPVNELAIGDTYNSSCYIPTRADVTAEVWQAIIAGARGISFFNSTFASNCGEAMNNDILLWSKYSGLRTELTTTLPKVKALAPVINSHFANGYESHTGSLNTMAKYCNSGVAVSGSTANCTAKFYVFATPKASGAQSITFTVKSGTTATVVDESRTIPITSGQFTDSFANETTTHIYRID